MKPILKYAGAIAGLVVLAALVLLAIDYYEYRKSPEYEARKIVKQLEEEERNDPYGGSTPEETMRSFIGALNNNEILLASKYFVLEDQEKWKEYLESVQEKKLLREMVMDLRKTNLTERGDTAFFTLVDENNVAVSELIMQKNKVSKKWKITEL